jgi:hypothetical protein
MDANVARKNVLAHQQKRAAAKQRREELAKKQRIRCKKDQRQLKWILFRVGIASKMGFTEIDYNGIISDDLIDKLRQYGFFVSRHYCFISYVEISWLPVTKSEPRSFEDTPSPMLMCPEMIELS